MNNNQNMGSPYNNNNNGNFNQQYAPYTPPLYGYQNVPGYVNTNMFKKKEPLPFTKRDGIFFVLFTLCGLLLSDLAIFGNMNLGFTISYIILFAVTTAYLGFSRAKHLSFGILCGILSIAGSVVFTLHKDNIMSTCLVFLIVALFIIYTSCLSGRISHPGSYRIIKPLWQNALFGFTKFSEPFTSIRANKSKNGKKFSEFIIGVVIALPVGVILMVLLSQADQAYEAMVKTVLSSLGVLVGILALGTLITILYIPYSFAVKKVENSESSPIKPQGTIATTVTGMFMAVISLVYLSYLFSQLAYFFSAFKGLLPNDFSVSDYARRGFFEMCAVSAISILIIGLSLALTKRSKKGKVSISIKIFGTFIGLFSLLMIGISFSKMVMYINSYGLTRLRVQTTAFMIMLAIVAIMAIIHIFVPKIPYVQVIVVLCSAIFIILCLADVDTVIAKYNTNAYESGKLKTVDVNAMAELSDGAIPYLAELCGDKDEDVAKKAKHALYVKFENDYPYSFDSKKQKFSYTPTYMEHIINFKYYNADRHKAVAALNGSKELISALNDPKYDFSDYSLDFESYSDFV